MIAGTEGVGHGRGENGGEPERTERTRGGHRPLRSARDEEDRQREQVQEVAVADRAPAAIPVVGDRPYIEEVGESQGRHRQPAGHGAGPAGEEEDERDEGREEIQEHPRVASDPEIAQVAEEGGAHLGPGARRSPAPRRLARRRAGSALFHGRPQLVGRGPDAAVSEGHGLGLEGKRAVECLALAALVVHLAGDCLVRSKERPHRGRDHRRPERGSSEAFREGGIPAPEKGLHAEGQREQHVVGLRVRGQPDEDRRQQRPLAPPGHESGGDEGEVEQLRLGPDEVQRRDGSQEEQQRGGQRARGRALPPQLRVREDDGQREAEGVGDEQAARAEELHERRPPDSTAGEPLSRDRIQERLREIDAGLLFPDAPQPRKAGRAVPDETSARPLQEDALRARGKLAPDADDVARFVAQVAVLGQAPGHGVIGGAVGPELRDARGEG